MSAVQWSRFAVEPRDRGQSWSSSFLLELFQLDGKQGETFFTVLHLSHCLHDINSRSSASGTTIYVSQAQHRHQRDLRRSVMLVHGRLQNRVLICLTTAYFHLWGTDCCRQQCNATHGRTLSLPPTLPDVNSKMSALPSAVEGLPSF